VLSPSPRLASTEAYRLLAQEAFLRATTEGVALLDPDGTYAFVNERLARTLGYGVEELLGRSLVDDVGERARDRVRAALVHARAGAEEQQDVPLRRKDGSLLWALLATSPVRDAGGRTVGVLGVLIDVTERHRAEENLRVIADASGALASQLDFDGVARVVARAIDGGVVAALFSSHDALTTRACACVDERIDERMQDFVGRTTAVLPGSVSEEVQRRHEPVLLGREIIQRLHPEFAELARQFDVGSVAVAPLLVYGSVIGILGMFRTADRPVLEPPDADLLREIADRAAMSFERARLFEEQHRAAERLRLLADAGTLLATSLDVGPAITSLVRLIVQWFAHACALQLFTGTVVTAAAVAACDPELEDATRRAILACRRDHGTPDPSLARVLLSGAAELVREVDDDTLRDLAVDEEQLAALRPLGLRSVIRAPLVAQGRVLGVLTVARTLGRPYDDDDLALAAELGRRAALAFDNARLYKRAHDAIALRDEFLSIASHELNTPLTPLKMHLDTLRRGGFPPERANEKLDAAARQVDRLARLVAELLDVSRIGEGRLRLKPERFDLASVVDQVVASMADDARRASSTVYVNALRPCYGTWDRARMEQVITNLLANALKYGSGHPIDVDLSGNDRAVRLVVRDRGIGIPIDHQRLIFERFGRATSARHYGGFGLGLWIVQRIVEGSGGTVSVESEPQQGAAFAVDLPREPPARSDE
jgi:PAS domain S-box-containing protein